MFKYTNLPLYTTKYENQDILVTTTRILISFQNSTVYENSIESYRAIGDVINGNFTLICLLDDNSTFICTKDQDWFGLRYVHCYFFHDKSRIYFRDGTIHKCDQKWTEIQINDNINVGSHSYDIQGCTVFILASLLRINMDEKYVHLHYHCHQCNTIHIDIYSTDCSKYFSKGCCVISSDLPSFKNISSKDLLDIWTFDKQVFAKYNNRSTFVYSHWLPSQLDNLSKSCKRKLAYNIWLSKKLKVPKNLWIHNIFPLSNFKFQI